MSHNETQRRYQSPRAMAIFAILFALVIILLAVYRRTSWVVPVYYATTGLITYLFYAVDKSAAIKGRSRISEKSLHLLAVAGGWTGAAAAQRLLRHKSRKPGFQLTYRITVFVNCTSFAALLVVREWAW